MAHLTARSGYRNLVHRLNRHPQGATESELLYRILAMLFSEREAELAALLPIKPFSAGKAAGIWKMPEAEAKKVLDDLAGRGILVDIQARGRTHYVLPPPMAGFFEFSLMRVRGDIDQKLLSELFHQYINVEEDFVKALFTEGQTQLGRTFVNETVLTGDNALHVLDYERASEVIESARAIGIGMCYCRHKAQHLEKACDAPMNICMTFNNTARSLNRHGITREVDRAEARDLLAEACDRDLVQFGENVQKRVGFICNCCGCCCEAMVAARRFGILDPVHTTNFLPVVSETDCSGCGRCVTVCPVEAASLTSANDPARPKRKLARIDERLCLGCGVCVKNCSPGAMALRPRAERVITPVDSVHKTVLMAMERDRLQDLIFDNRVLFSHRALAAVLGVILKLEPVKRTVAARMLGSRYVEKVAEKAGSSA